MARPLKPLLILPLLLCGALPICAQDELTIAAASDLQPVMKAIVTRFEKETGSKTKITFGSSGNFFAQLQMWQWLTPRFARYFW